MRPKLANAPRIIPQGKFNIRTAACFDVISSDEYLSSQRNLKSDNTKVPL